MRTSDTWPAEPREEQFLKAYAPMDLTELGSERVLMAHPRKADAPMD